MKKTWLRIAYVGVLGVTFLMNSCQDDPITPNEDDGSTPTWESDTTVTDPGNEEDTTVWNDPNGNDSTVITDPIGGGDPADSTGGTDPIGGGDPADSTGGGGFPGDSIV